jgi:hypothetical protein
MHTNTTLAMLALAVFTAPLSAQLVVNNDENRTRSTAKVPPGHLPPKGMCRVWIDGVPPGRQPAVTDCATAERNRTANSRVIYGEVESFPGKGKGKLRRAQTNGDIAQRCTVTDAVVVNGRIVDVCRDDTIRRDRRGRVIRADQGDDDEDDLRRDRRGRSVHTDDDDDDDDKFEKRDKVAKVKANKEKKGKNRDRD